MSVRPKLFLKYEWDAIAGIIAAIIAIILHFLHIANADVLLPIILALMGLLFINFLRHSKNNETSAEVVNEIRGKVEQIQSTLHSPDIILIGPRRLRSVNEQFLKNMSGDVVFYNICLRMYQSEAMFDALLLPAINNGHVSSIQFILDVGQKSLWTEDLAQRIKNVDKRLIVREPKWRSLPLTISFIMAENMTSANCEALLSFWGDPFMSYNTHQDSPRYIFHVLNKCELIPQLELLTHSSPDSVK
ncbi:hypothetical protein [Methylophaga sp. OBS4]|uniref:hypothetical protein n=1 Tax=Methylophaga sp. OBS4 TaxID=2991935 RepID=UPI00225B1FE3|nr:hypothetical protein [Methylophaga sp. OBS4]MCX4187484.1 hypothetical protein [Methylophaga sp. OBS4]